MVLCSRFLVSIVTTGSLAVSRLEAIIFPAKLQLSRYNLSLQTDFVRIHLSFKPIVSEYDQFLKKELRGQNMANFSNILVFKLRYLLTYLLTYLLQFHARLAT